jgi:hypothetical protein
MVTHSRNRTVFSACRQSVEVVTGNGHQKSTVEGKIQKAQELSSGVRKIELLSALWVTCCCDYGTGIVRDPRKRNVIRWKPVPEDR